MHIPKAAGSSFKSLLWKNLPTDRVFNFRAMSMDKDVEDFRAATRTVRDRFDAVQSHVPFGLHEYLNPWAEYVTILRDPIGRIVSQYRYVYSTPHHPDYELVGEAGMSFESYISLLADRNRLNVQSMWISGVLNFGNFRAAASDIQLPADMIERAKKNLDNHFRFAAPIEEYEAFIICVARRWNWRRQALAAVNETTRTVAKPDISVATRTWLEQLCEADMMLYETVQRRFAQDRIVWGVDEHSTSKLRRRNAILGKLAHLRRVIREGVR